MITSDKIEEKLKGHVPDLMDSKRRSAVIIPLIEDEGGLRLLFETRAMNIEDPGEVCFPGGRIEPGEAPLSAALRECSEELGISETDIEMIGPSDILSAYGGRVIYSFAAKIKAKRLCPCKDEVHELFTVPLEWFIQNPPEDRAIPLYPHEPVDFDSSVFGCSGPYPWKRYTYELPVWKYGSHYIWGFTARILRAFLNIIR